MAQKSGKFRLNFDPQQVLRKRVPILQWLSRYTISKFSRDLLAGLSVALTEVPQGIAYAVIAGLPPEYGLYSGLMGGFMYLIFGSCKDLNIGPTSILCLMLQSHVAALGTEVAVLITFFTGLIVLSLGLLHLGFLIDFFSYPIVAGFTCAASLQIASSQIKSLLGIPGKANEFLEAWEAVVENFYQISLWDTVLGVTSILVLVALREIRVFGSLKRRPDWSNRRNIIGVFIFMLSLARNALVVLAGTLIAYCWREENIFKITGSVKGGFPPFGPPTFTTTFNGTFYDFSDMVQEIGPSMVFIPLVAILETVTIAKSFANGKAVDATQEMIALGICNLMGSMVRSMPVTGSFSRSAINNSSGVKTTVAGSVSALIMVLVIAFLTKSFYYIPKATLAGVIICSMMYLFEFDAFVLLWKNKKIDLLPFLATFLCGLFLNLEYGIMAGIALNLLFVLYASARPKLAMTKEKFSNHGGEVYVLTPRDTLYFPAAEFLRDTILGCEGQGAVILVDGKNVRSVDFTIAKSLVVSASELSKNNETVVFVNFKESIKNICLGIDKTVEEHFRSGDLEKIVTDINCGGGTCFGA